MDILFEKERKAFVKSARACSGNTYMARVLGNSFDSMGQGPCHGNFSGGWRGIEYAIWDSRDYRLPKEHKELYEEWLLWFLNESPWAPFFVSKTVEEVHDYGFCMDARIPESSQGGQAMIASRFWTEAHNASSFKVLRENYIALKALGLSVQDCFLLSFTFKHAGKGKFYHQPHNCGHSPFNVTRYSESAWRHYYNGTFGERKKVKTFSEYGGYSGGLGCQVALNDESALNSEAFWLTIRKIRPRSVEEKQDHNIFRKVVEGQVQFDKEGLLDIVSQLKGLL